MFALRIFTKEHKEKLKLAKINFVPWNKGLKNKGICKAWNKGMRHSASTINKMKHAHKNQRSPMLGKKHSESFKIQMSKRISGNNHPMWKGGKSFDKDGYIIIKNPKMPGSIREHRYVMELNLGRKLKSYEHVHHINAIKHDNRIENLQIIKYSDHIKLHRKLEMYGKWSKAGHKNCLFCHKNNIPHKALGLCRHCYYYEIKAGGFLTKHPKSKEITCLQ